MYTLVCTLGCTRNVHAGLYVRMYQDMYMLVCTLGCTRDVHAGLYVRMYQECTRWFVR